MKTKKYDNKINLHKLFGIVFLVIFTISAQHIIAQVNSEPGIKENQNKPDVKIKVNKELDNDGNIIRYDSTYSWTWSSDGDMPMPQEFLNDSMATEFFNPFDKKFFFGNNNLDGFGFFTDSLFIQPFDSPDFDHIQKQMQEMMLHQQKMMEDIFGEPPVLPVLPENKNNQQNKTPVTKTVGSVDI